MNRSTAKRPVIFITGTDTGVGKTLLTSLLLQHLRRKGCHALAMKPFCSGSRADVRKLHAIQDGELTPDEINPYFFKEPLAPWVAARKHRRAITLRQVLHRIHRVEEQCEQLIIEGVGGLLVPLGEGYTVADLITELDCKVVVVVANRLGMINHALLTLQALQHIGIRQLTVVVMAVGRPDPSSESNSGILAELAQGIPVLKLGFLGPKPNKRDAVKAIEKKVAKTLAQISG